MTDQERIEELEDAVRDILDIATGWTRPMSDEKRLGLIKMLAYEALGIEEKPA